MAIASIPPLLRSDTIRAKLDEMELVSVVSGLTLFLVVIFGFDHWITKIITNAAFVGALIFPSWIRSPVFWLTIALGSTTALAIDWYVADNHKYLLVYWLWVMVVAHLQPTKQQAEDILRWHARFFLIFIFLGAAAQRTGCRRD